MLRAGLVRSCRRRIPSTREAAISPPSCPRGANANRSERRRRTSKGAERRGREGVSSLDDLHHLRALSGNRVRIGKPPRSLSRNSDQIADTQCRLATCWLLRGGARNSGDFSFLHFPSAVRVGGEGAEL